MNNQLTKINLEYIVSAVAMERSSKYITYIKVEDCLSHSTDYLYGCCFFKKDTDVIAQMTEWGKTHITNCAEGLSTPDDYWSFVDRNRLREFGNTDYRYQANMGAAEILIPNVGVSLVFSFNSK